MNAKDSAFFHSNLTLTLLISKHIPENCSFPLSKLNIDQSIKAQPQVGSILSETLLKSTLK